MGGTWHPVPLFERSSSTSFCSHRYFEAILFVSPIMSLTTSLRSISRDVFVFFGVVNLQRAFKRRPLQAVEECQVQSPPTSAIERSERLVEPKGARSRCDSL